MEVIQNDNGDNNSVSSEENCVIENSIVLTSIDSDYEEDV